MILELRGVHAVYGRSHVLHGVTLAAREGEVVSLLGRNGAGKSTTLKAVVGLVRVTGGEVVFRGRSLGGSGSRRILLSCSSCLCALDSNQSAPLPPRFEESEERELAKNLPSGVPA